MTKLEQAARQALEALKDYHKADDDKVSVAMSILQEALAEQAEQEPVAWLAQDDTFWLENGSDTDVPLYAAPFRTKDLTDDEKLALAKRFPAHLTFDAINAVIAADREKNK